MESHYTSEPIKFIVEGIPMNVHRGLVASVSKPLERLINESTTEAQNDEVILKDVDQTTFAYFCQWAYTGSYNPEDHCDRPKNQEIAEPTASPTQPTMNSEPCSRIPERTPLRLSLTPQTAMSRDQAWKTEMLKSFFKLQFCEADVENMAVIPCANPSLSDEIAAFLSDVRVYVFAEKYDARPLKELALKKSHEKLFKFFFWPGSVADVVALIRFVYNETFKPTEEVEPMRSMLKLYMGFQLSALCETTAFRDLLAESRDLLDDYCSCLKMRMMFDANLSD